jgi:MFS family permease
VTNVARGVRSPVLAILAGSAAAGSVGLAAGGTAGALLGTELAGTTAAAGLPLGLLVLGSDVSAMVIARQSNRAGRASGLALGYLLGTAGAVMCVIAAVVGNLPLFLVGSTLLGSANAAVFLTRYAAADVGGAAAGGRALGLTLFAAAAGAVLSPLLLGPTGDLAAAAGLPRLTGIYVIAGVAFAGAAVALSRTRRLPRGERRPPSPPWRVLAAATLAAPTGYAVLVLAGANFAMVGLMAIAPVHLMAHGHDLEMIGTIISLHVAGMFVPSPLSGWLADRTGPGLVAAIGVGLLVVAATGTAVGGTGVGMLVVLGVGWNFGLVGGSAMITRAVDPSLRVHVEGVGEVAMGVAAAAGAPLAGLLIA